MIAGATNSTYTLVDADVGSQISVQASYTDAQGTPETVTSVQTAPVANVNDIPVGVPTITGTVTEDQTLTADTSAISDADGLGAFSYQWLRNGGVIAGATGSSYSLTDADVGAHISVQVSYTDGQGTPEAVTSAQTAAVANVNDPGSVSIDNIFPAQGDTLAASVSDADGASGIITFQWYRDGVAISGATGVCYTAVQADVGTVITVIADYTDDQGTVESLISEGTAEVSRIPKAEAPTEDTQEKGDDLTEPEPGIAPEESETTAAPEEGMAEDIPEVAAPPVNSDPAEEPVSRQRGTNKSRTPFLIQGDRHFTPTPRTGVDVKTSAERLSDKDATPQKLAVGNPGTHRPDQQMRISDPMSARAYLNMVNSLNEVKEEVTEDIAFNKTVLGSAITVSTGLSVGYVFWLIRGGMLLSTLLSSLPAWQILDPLPILARKNGNDETEDDESLESILKRKPRHSDPKKKPSDGSSDAEEAKR